MKKLVIVKNNQAITTSLKVAEIFGKRHADVMRKISELLENLDIEHKRIFAFMSQNLKVGHGAIRQNHIYTMNRDGFTLLAMGFTGNKALEFKLAYIDAFNQMEAQLVAKSTKSQQIIPTPNNQSIIPIPNKLYNYIHTELGTLDPTINKFYQIIQQACTAAVKEAMSNINHKAMDSLSHEEKALAEAVITLREESFNKGKISGMLTMADKLSK